MNCDFIETATAPFFIRLWRGLLWICFFIILSTYSLLLPSWHHDFHFDSCDYNGESDCLPAFHHGLQSNCEFYSSIIMKSSISYFCRAHLYFNASNQNDIYSWILNSEFKPDHFLWSTLLCIFFHYEMHYLTFLLYAIELKLDLGQPCAEPTAIFLFII